MKLLQGRKTYLSRGALEALAPGAAVMDRYGVRWLKGSEDQWSSGSLWLSSGLSMTSTAALARSGVRLLEA